MTSFPAWSRSVCWHGSSEGPSAFRTANACPLEAAMLDLGMLSKCSRAFDALSDPTSLKIVDFLFQGTRTSAAMANSLSINRGAIEERLSSLVNAGLVVTSGNDRKRLCSLHPALIKKDDLAKRIDLGSCAIVIRGVEEDSFRGRLKRFIKSSPPADPEFLEKCARVFRVFSNMNRIAIVNLLIKGKEIDESMIRTLPIDESDIARNVSILERAGIIQVGERNGTTTYQLEPNVYKKEKFLDLIDFGFCSVGFRFRHLDDSKMELGVV